MSLRFFLRDATRSAHEALDASVGPLDSVARYGGFVSASYAHRAPIEAFLRQAEWPKAFGRWRPAQLSEAIAADLDDLGCPLPAVAPFAMEDDLASLVGVSYVLEGSALGARLIVRMAAALGFDENHGARHLVCQSASLENWRGLLAIMDGLSGIDRAAAARAANAVFAQARRAMAPDDARVPTTMSCPVHD